MTPQYDLAVMAAFERHQQLMQEATEFRRAREQRANLPERARRRRRRWF
jgi:hypothetical protein